jgi:hypothetical protein
VKIIEKNEDGTETTLYPSTESPPAVAAAEAQGTPATQSTVKRKKRSHLDVLIDRAKRRIAPIERIVDEVRELADIEGPALGDIADQALAYLRKLVDEMESARSSGRTGKVTAKSRALTKLRPGTRVRLSPGLAAEFKQVYSHDDLIALHIDRTVGDHVWLTTGEKSCGRWLWSDVVPVGEETSK